MKVKTELRVRRVPEPVMTELKNLTKNLGVDVSAFIKSMLREKLSSYPEHLRKNIID